MARIYGFLWDSNDVLFASGISRQRHLRQHWQPAEQLPVPRKHGLNRAPDPCPPDGGPPTAVGRPVCLTNGKVFFTHTDAVVGSMVVSRTYNSGRSATGWYNALDSKGNASFKNRLRILNANTIKTRQPDGFAQYYINDDGDKRFDGILPYTKQSWSRPP
jgi:hypothetical protein